MKFINAGYLAAAALALTATATPFTTTANVLDISNSSVKTPEVSITLWDKSYVLGKDFYDDSGANSLGRPDSSVPLHQRLWQKQNAK